MISTARLLRFLRARAARQREAETFVNLGNRRGLFEIPEGVVYLNCAYMSPQPRAVRKVGEGAVGRKSRPWEIVPKDFFENSERARALFAELVGGEADRVAIIPSVSYGMAVAAANIPVETGQKSSFWRTSSPRTSTRGARWQSARGPSS